MNEQTPHEPPHDPPAMPPDAGGAPTSDERNMGMLCHLLGIVASYTIGLGFVGPLIIWLLKKDQSRFIDHHGKEALNFQLTMLIAAIVCGLLIFVFIGILLFPVLIIVSLVLEIMACVAASRGEWYRYPFCIRFIQ